MRWHYSRSGTPEHVFSTGDGGRLQEPHLKPHWSQNFLHKKNLFRNVCAAFGQRLGGKVIDFATQW